MLTEAKAFRVGPNESDYVSRGDGTPLNPTISVLDRGRSAISYTECKESN